VVRSINNNEKNREKINAMKAKGTTLIEGDTMKPETLLPLCVEISDDSG
jgi:hypothetical protein